MIKLNKLPTMAFHFFEAPNKVLITDDNYNNMITAEIEENFNEDFVLDSKCFDLVKKLTNVKFDIGKTIKITGDNGKFKCNHIEKARPQLNITNIICEQDYNLDELKLASKFVITRHTIPFLKGVVVYDDGTIFASDRFKIYGNIRGGVTGKYWSIPTQFIALAQSGKLKFTENKVISEGDYTIYSNTLVGEAPNFSKLFDVVGDEYALKLNNNLNLFQSETIAFNIVGSKVVYKLEDQEQEFVVEDDCGNFGNVDCKFKASLKDFLLGLSVDNKITINKNILMFGNKVIIMRMI